MGLPVLRLWWTGLEVTMKLKRVKLIFYYNLLLPIQPFHETGNRINTSPGKTNLCPREGHSRAAAVVVIKWVALLHFLKN